MDIKAAVLHGFRDLRVSERPTPTPGPLEVLVPCGRCRECRAGRYTLCPDVQSFATPPVDGALAQYVTIHEDFAHPVPDSLSDDAAALVKPLSVGIQNRELTVTGPF